jgi:hypothetical protein
MSNELNVNQPYDPNKKYKWTPTDEFVISGSDFGLILNTLRSILATQEAARILLANDAHSAIERILANNVANGTVKEVEENSPTNSL